MNNIKTKNITLVAMSVALLTISSYLSIPIPFLEVPLSLQTLSVFMIGFLLTPIMSFSSVIIWIVLGAIGLPVFAGGEAGLGVLLGFKGGYIISFAVAAIFISAFKGAGNNVIRYIVIMLIANLAIVYPIGVFVLSKSLNLDFNSALKAGMYPFLIGDFIKIVVAAYASKKVKQSIYSSSSAKTKNI